MTKQQTVERHLSATQARWEEVRSIDCTDDAVTRRDGDTFDSGTPKFELDFSGVSSPKSGVIAAQTAKSILESHGYEAFYAKREGNANRDPKRLTVIVTPGAEPVTT